MCNILICLQKHNQHNNDEWTHFFRKIYLSLYSKGFERVTKGIICERRVEEWTELQPIDPPNSSAYNSISFPFSWAAQPGAWEPNLCWDMVLIPASSLKLPDFLSHLGYILALDVHLLPEASQFALNSTRRQSRLSPDKFDWMYLLFTQLHFSSDSSAGWGQYVTDVWTWSKNSWSNSDFSQESSCLYVGFS